MTHYLIKEMLPEERPREKMLALGTQALTPRELLAILIGSGTKGRSALDIAGELVGDLLKDEALARTQDLQELTVVHGLGPSKAAVIMAALLVMSRLRHENQEHFQVILLNSKGRVTAIKEISQGSLNASVVHPREVFAPAVVHHAAALLAVHNHPSGDPTPSQEDRDLTRTLVKAGEILGIPVVDHLVIGDGVYYSFKEHDLI